MGDFEHKSFARGVQDVIISDVLTRDKLISTVPMRVVE